MQITLDLNEAETEILYAFAAAREIKVTEAAIMLMFDTFEPVDLKEKQAINEELVTRYHAEKYSVSEISRKTGLSNSGVRKIRDRLGLPAFHDVRGKLITTKE